VPHSDDGGSSRKLTCNAYDFFHFRNISLAKPAEISAGSREYIIISGHIFSIAGWTDYTQIMKLAIGVSQGARPSHSDLLFQILKKWVSSQKIRIACKSFGSEIARPK